jgi:hypothetical protein
MGYYLRRFVGGSTDAFSDEQLRDIAEQALALQLELARDVLAVAERSRIPAEQQAVDQRIARARLTVQTLG